MWISEPHEEIIEYDYVPLSSSIRDADSNSVFDKYESFLPKANESLLIQNKVSCEATMKQIRLLFGPITNEEIAFYMQRMDDGEGNVINEFQRTLIFQLFAKYFGDPYTERSINKINYIELVIAATRYLLANNMWVLPYVISSKMDRVQNKKNINKNREFSIISKDSREVSVYCRNRSDIRNYWYYLSKQIRNDILYRSKYRRKVFG